MLCLFFIAGCSADNTKTEEKKEEKAAEEENKAEIVDIPKAPKTLEEMIQQPAGSFVEKYIDKEIEIVHSANVLKYSKFYDTEFKPILEKELPGYFQENKELSKEDVYDYLVYLLGSGVYKEYYDQLISYENGFEMPELPDGEDQVETKKKEMNAVILLDGSGSMKGEVPGGSKMALAKETIGKFVQELGDDVNVSLIVYGHVGTGNDSDKKLSCSSIESVYPLQPFQADSFNQAVNSFQASGWTPLAGAIEKAGDMLKGYDSQDYENVVYIVSDGIETCDGDPVGAAKKLQENNIKAKVNIIGFDVDDEGQKQLKEVADAGDGIYATVRDKSELETQVLKKWRPTMWELIMTQGPGLKDTTEAWQRLIDIHNPLYYASTREESRIKNAAYFLSDKKLISDEAKSYVLSTAEEMSEIRESHFKEIYEKKEEEMWAASKEIDAKIEEWRKGWEEKLGDDAYKP
jgi:Ca-activated chloride channel homolog